MAGFVAPQEDLVQPTGAVNAFGDPLLGTSPVDPRRAQDLGDAILAGLQSSATGLAVRGKLPEQQLSGDAPWYHRAAAGAAGVAVDLPLSVVGAVAGAAAGSAVLPVGGTLVGGGAGAFAAPMALRDALIEAYSHNHALSWSGVWEIAKAAMKGGGKGAVIGAATGGAGALVGRAAMGAIGPAVGTGVTARTAIGAAEGAAFGAELATLTATSAALEGHMPTWQDFMDNAILLGGMKAAVHTAQGLRNIYAETGKRPEEVLADAQRDPAIKDALTGAVVKPDAVIERVVGKLDPESTTFPERQYPVKLKNNEDATVTFAMRDSDTLAFRLRTADGEQMGGGAFFPVEGKPGRWEGHYSIESQFRRRGAMTAAMDVFERVSGQKLQPSGSASADALALWASRNKSRLTIPEAYRGLALEQRVQAAVDRDVRPEMVRKVLSGEKEWVPVGENPLKDPVKYEYIADKETATGVLRSVTEMYQAEIAVQTRGVVSNKATAVEALKTISDGALGEHIVGKAGNAAEIYARAHMLRGATNHAVAELKKIAATPEAELTPTAKLTALAAIERVAMLKAEMEGVGAEAGRALQIFRRVKRDPSFLGEAQNLITLAERKGSLQNIARYVDGLKDTAQAAEFMRQHAKATTMEKVQEGWKAAILSGPQTHLANILGNLTKYIVEVPENVIAASLIAINKGAKGDPLTLAQWKARAFAGFYGIQHGAKDALHVAAEVWRGRGESLEKADVYRTAIEGRKGEIIRTPFKALQVEDALFRTVMERAKAYEMAIDRAVKEGLHPETKEGREAVSLYTQRPEIGLTDAQAAKALETIQHAGAEAVFAQRLGPKMEMLQRATQGSLLGFVVPFVRTPTNLVSWAIQHVPGLNLLSGRWRADYMAGGEARAKAVARVTIGVGLTLTAYQLAEDGIITGGGLFDKEEGGTKRAAGWQPYSVKIGDTYYSFQRMEPVAKVIGLAADLIELQKASADEEDKAKIASMLVLLFGNATVSTTYLSGVSNVIQAVTDPARAGENLLEQYATSLVPKIVGQSVAMVDPHKREVEGVLDAIQSQLPFLREKLLPKRDVWGEPAANSKWFAVMPVATSKISEDKVKTEAVRLELAIQDAPRFIMEKGPFNPKDKRLELTQEQRDIFREVAGKNAMALLAPIVNAPDWEGIPDFAKAAIYKGVLESTRRQAAQAALPADSAAREALRHKIVDRIIRETQEAQDKAQRSEKK